VLLEALRTDAVKSSRLPKDGKGGDKVGLINEAIRGIEHISHGAAMDTDHVMVGGGVAVEAFLSTRGTDDLDVAVSIQDLQIAVNRSKTYLGKFLANHVVNFVSRGMRRDRAEFFQYDLTLLGQPACGSGYIHSRGLVDVINNYYLLIAME
jgi:hypothetical protein